MILTAVALLQKNPKPTREQIIRGMEQNLCRCGAHTRIIDAIVAAAGEMKGGRVRKIHVGAFRPTLRCRSVSSSFSRLLACSAGIR
jgi:xanthine dehydrogenase iron-sulfur cluster and FAD-binding subunit A